MKSILIFTQFIFLSMILPAQNWLLVWQDEFNQPGLPDSTRWSYEVGMVRNQENQFYTLRRSENARIEDTVLIIEARKETSFGSGSTCTSASLTSQFKGDWRYGKIEVMAKIPTGKGTWPAIWMMPSLSEYGGWPRSGEIDIMESVGFDPEKLFFTVHFEGTDGTGHSSNGTNKVFTKPYSQFLKYAVVWSPDRIDWYVNDVKYHSYVRSGNDPRTWPFDKEFYLILNLAIGGAWGGMQGVDYTLFPHRLYIDYVRVYQQSEGNPPYLLDVSDSPGGSVTINPQKSAFDSLELVTLTASPAEGYTFHSWMFHGASNPITLRMHKNLSIIPVFEKKNEILINPEFDLGLLFWNNLYLSDPETMEAAARVENGIYTFEIVKPGSQWWHIGDQQLGLSVKKGHTYQLNFTAWADHPASLGTSLSRNYGDYGGYFEKFYNVSTTQLQYSWKFTPSTDDSNCRLYFGMGNFPAGKVFLDHLSLTDQTLMKVSDNMETQRILLYPNPANDHFSVRIPSILTGSITVTLQDITGREIKCWTEELRQEKNDFIFSLDRSFISRGWYLVSIRQNSRIVANTKLVLE